MDTYEWVLFVLDDEERFEAGGSETTYADAIKAAEHCLEQYGKGFGIRVYKIQRKLVHEVHRYNDA